MANENIEGVDVVNPTGKVDKLDYRKSDLAEIYKKANAHSWQDLVRFIEQKGDSVWHITPGEALAMKDDLQHLAQQNVPFTDNPDQAYEEAHKYRGQDQPKEQPQARQAERR